MTFRDSLFDGLSAIWRRNASSATHSYYPWRRASGGRRRNKKGRRTPRLEPLEDRRLLALFTGPFGADGTWNVYEVVEEPQTWSDAHASAEAATFEDVPGHLVSLHSDHESNFVRYIAKGVEEFWIGLTDNETYGGVETGSDPEVARTRGMPGESAGWVWTSGEAYTYERFFSGEPNDFGDGEDAVSMSQGRWVDRGIGSDGRERASDGRSRVCAGRCRCGARRR